MRNSRSDESYPTGGGLAGRTLWNFTNASAAQFTARAMAMVRGVILARLLVPEDFGIVALGAAWLGLLSTMGGAGFEAALIQRKQINDRFISTGFTINFAALTGLAILAAVTAPLYGRFYDEVAVRDVTLLLALALPISALTLVPTVKLARALDFRRRVVAEVGGAFVHSVTAVALAWYGARYWSLAVGLLLGQIALVLLLYRTQPWRPRFSIHGGDARELFRFGRFVLASGVLAFAVLNLDDLLVGKVLGLELLGFYAIAYRWANLPATDLGNGLGKVLFPTFSVMQGDRDRVAKAYLRAVQGLALIICPLSLGMMAVAPDFVAGILGEQWTPTIPALRILCIYGLLRSLGAQGGSMRQALGRPDVTVKGLAVFLVLLGISIVPACQRYGVTGAAAAVTICALIVNAGMLVANYRVAGVRVSAFLKVILFPLFLSSMMAFFVSRVGSNFLSNLTPLQRLPLLVLIGAVLYLVPVFVFQREFVLSLIRRGLRFRAGTEGDSVSDERGGGTS